MNISVQVKGLTEKPVERFRAYAAATLIRKPSGADHVARAKNNEAPFKPRDRVKYEGEDIAFSGDVSGDKFTVDAGETTITKIVLYRGAIESEAVAGSAEVNASGKIEVTIEDTES